MRRDPPSQLALAYLDELRAGRRARPVDALSSAAPGAPVGIAAGPPLAGVPRAVHPPGASQRAIASADPLVAVLAQMTADVEQLRIRLFGSPPAAPPPAYGRRRVAVGAAVGLLIAVVLGLALVARAQDVPQLQVGAEADESASASCLDVRPAWCEGPANVLAISSPSRATPTGADEGSRRAARVVRRDAAREDTGTAVAVGLLALALAVVVAGDASRKGRTPILRPPAATAPAPGPHLAIESRKGPVRARCEDRSAGFICMGVDVLVAADGLGGMPEGERAAELAVAAAVRFIRRELRKRPRARTLTAIAREAIGAAERAVRRAAPTYGFGPEKDGLSTTLLVLLADASRYGAAYLGDGAMVVVRETGAVEPLMVAMKGEGANIVTGSIGPCGLEGIPVASELPRRAGDIAIVATDGVADRVPVEFPARLRVLLAERGDVRETVAVTLDALEQARDEMGPLADDNLTLGIVRAPD